MSFLHNIFSEQFIYSLGWTLVHSLWQGALIGLGIALSMLFLHKYTARLRYFIHSIGLFVIAALALITFITSYTSYEPDRAQPVQLMNSGFIEIQGQSSVNSLNEEGGITMSSMLGGIVSYCHEHFPLFVGVWLLGMLAMMLRFLGGYALVRRYRHHRVKPVIGDWDRKFQNLANKIGLRKRVRLLESALVKVPVAIGYFKPIVLIPLGALNGVPAQQMEAILVHELAHIHRRDYLINMIQSLLEVVFFYHPVVWWLSGNIRLERENICDDIAITQTGNTMEFAKALTNIQELNLGSPALAASLSGKNKNRLLIRIRRIAGKPKIHSGFTEGFIAASILLISLVGLSAAAMISNPTDYELPMVLNFNEVGGELPEMNYYMETAIIPDTTEKEKKAQLDEQKRQEEQKAIQRAMEENQEEIQAAIQLEMEALKERMKVLDAEIQEYVGSEDYQEAYEKAMQSREEYKDQMKKAMGAYEEAMEEWKANTHKNTNWTLISDLHNPYYTSDSSVWHQYHPNAYFHSDSLSEIYIDSWTESWEDYEDIVIIQHGELNDFFKNYEELIELKEENVLIIESELAELAELMEASQLEVMEIQEMDFDFDYDYNFEYTPFVDGSIQRIVKDELLEDGLIESGREYIVKIGEKQMYINGEKQSRSVFKKYRRLVDSSEEPWFMDKDAEISIHIGR